MNDDSNKYERFFSDQKKDRTDERDSTSSWTKESRMICNLHLIHAF
jgi:hypothetical protein